jgi:unsaturated rhamnogalacturonyl hydrolase
MKSPRLPASLAASLPLAANGSSRVASGGAANRAIRTLVTLSALMIARPMRAETAPEPPPTPAQIVAQLSRVRAFLDAAMPPRIVSAQTHREITPTDAPAADAIADLGEAGAFNPLAYEVGVIHTGMLHAAEATGDRRFADFTARRLEFIAIALPYFRAQAQAFGAGQNSFHTIFAPAALDDCGALAAAMIQARRAGIGPNLEPVITNWCDFIAHGQFRLADGTLARHRPQPVSVWADDLYMSVPALAQMGSLSGRAEWWNDAVLNARQISARLFRPSVGLYAHGWHENNPTAPDVFWGRANGWAMLALEALLDELPADHPGRAEVLALLQAQLRGVASLQSGVGLWHQVLDRNDSYLESSCSAMFVYGLAHAINRGWISPVTYGPIALEGWKAVAKQINAKGQVENTCVGTTLGSDMVFYYHRPVSVYAMHSYGAVLLAGSETIRLLNNPAVSILEKNGTYHLLPR